MTVLNSHAGYKPLDFGADGITGSVNRDGRIIALNCYHPQHGYVTLTSAAAFPDHERYNPDAVRAYRASLVDLGGFGLYFSEPITHREAELLEDAIPHIRLHFANGGNAEVTTFVCDGGAYQIWDVKGIQPSWGGGLSLQRCAYTQLTEGGPLPALPVEKNMRAVGDGILIVENPALGWAAALAGLTDGMKWDSRDIDSVGIQVFHGYWEGNFVLTYAFGATADIAAENVRRLARQDAGACLEEVLTLWRARWAGVPNDLLIRRGLAYSLMVAVPAGEGICLLTDHMILPLSWNRDSYYAARALLDWQPEMADIVRRHLLWMFEQAERPDGLWARCYMANGKIKDSAFQLDQQLFPLLELAEYVQKTGDQDTLHRLQRHIAPLFETLMDRKVSDAMLFPTDETPADDPVGLPFHLSSHILFWHVVNRLDTAGIAGDWGTLAAQLRADVDRVFIAEHNGQQIYAYAADAQGHYRFYHDANDLPLALAPTWRFVSADNPVWRATIEFAFSPDNAEGFYNGRLGSLHTRAPWPLGNIQQLLVARAIGDVELERLTQTRLHSTAQWDGALPEAYEAVTGDVVSRHWFAWPNAALCLAFAWQQH
jgi:hypothetical protein